MYTNTIRSVNELLADAENGRIAIPNIQRPYVWTPSQLARFIDSLMHGWPCGSILLWHTSSTEQNIFGVRRFLHQFCTSDTENEPSEASEHYEYLILDGQQRVQSLMLALSEHSRGFRASTMEWKRDFGGTGGKRTEYETRFLCFNLSGWTPATSQLMPGFLYLDYEEKELMSKPCLLWATEQEILDSDGAIVPLCRLPESSERYSEALGWLKEVIFRLRREIRIAVLEVSRINHKVESLDDDEAIVQIFTRLNTAGTPLTKEQIQAAKVKSLWPEFPEKIADLIDVLSKEPYRVQLVDDDLVNGFNIVLRAWFRTTDISLAYAKAGKCNTWEELWNRYAQYTMQTILALSDHKLFYRTEYKSLYVLWFPVAHMCCVNKFVFENDASCLVRWLLVTGWSKIWANRSGQYVKTFTARLIKWEESCDTKQWLSSILLGNERDESLISQAKNTITNLAASHRGSVRDYYMPLWVWTRMSEERIRFVLSFGYNAYAVDHIMPVARIKDPNLLASYNSIGNCWLLCTASNSSKSDDPFTQFLRNFSVKEDVKRISEILCTSPIHLEAGSPQEMSLENIKTRENSIKQDIMNYIDSEMELFFPNEEDVVQHKYTPDADGIYRGSDYLGTIGTLNSRTQGSYLSHVRTAMRKLQLTKENFENGLAQDAETLTDYRQRAREQGNASTGWGKYLDFLLGKKSNRTAVPLKNVSAQDSACDVSGIYRGSDYLKTIGTLNSRTQGSYLSHVRTAMRNLQLTEENFEQGLAQDAKKLEDYRQQAGEQGNASTGWGKYLDFLLGKRSNRTAVPLKNVSAQDSACDVSGIYRGSDYLKTIGTLGLGTQGSYLSHVRTAMRNLQLTEENFEQGLAQDAKKLEDYRQQAGEQGNASTGWGKYLDFLLGKRSNRTAVPLKNVSAQDSACDVSGIYRGSDYLKTIGTLGLGTQGSYLSHVRTAMRNLQLTEENFEQGLAQDAETLTDYRQRAREQGNASTGWGKYLDFLLGPNRAAVPQERIGQDSECTKALDRLEGVYADENSIVHEIIRRALDLGCSDERWVYMDELAVGRANRSHIQSMKTDAGNCYGRYFDSRGRGEDAMVRFVPEVWQKLIDLNWAK